MALVKIFKLKLLHRLSKDGGNRIREVVIEAQ